MHLRVEELGGRVDVAALHHFPVDRIGGDSVGGDSVGGDLSSADGTGRDLPRCDCASGDLIRGNHASSDTLELCDTSLELLEEPLVEAEVVSPDLASPHAGEGGHPGDDKLGELAGAGDVEHLGCDTAREDILEGADDAGDLVGEKGVSEDLVGGDGVGEDLVGGNGIGGDLASGDSAGGEAVRGHGTVHNQFTGGHRSDREIGEGPVRRIDPGGLDEEPKPAVPLWNRQNPRQALPCRVRRDVAASSGGSHIRCLRRHGTGAASNENLRRLGVGRGPDPR